MNSFDPIAEQAFSMFSHIYLGGIPPIITDDSAFLSFVCTLSATEALANYRYTDREPGKRFKQFVVAYFADPYPDLVDNLWKFRNCIIHAFSTHPFALVHHQSQNHLRKRNDGLIFLNAEDFYSALLSAAQKYFKEVHTSPELQEILHERLNEECGGIGVGALGLL